MAGGAFVGVASLQFGAVVVLGKLMAERDLPVPAMLAVRFALASPLALTCALELDPRLSEDDQPRPGRDWWAVAWLRGTEIATDALWSRSDAFRRPGARFGLWYAGASNTAMALGYGWLASRR